MLDKRLKTQLCEKMDPALWVAPEKTPLNVTRCSFGHNLSGVAKSRASCLDWRFFRGNSNDSNSVNRP
jgi:hypothetical protein